MYFIITSIIIYAMDRATKYLIIKNFYLGKSIPVFKPFLFFTYIQNKGAAFGLFPKLSLIITIISLLVVLLFIIFLFKVIKLPAAFQLPLGLILGGTAGNLTDRLKIGHVIDFIDFRVWPVFNIADSALTIAFIWLIILLITEDKKQVKNKFEIRSTKL